MMTVCEKLRNHHSSLRSKWTRDYIQNYTVFYGVWISFVVFETYLWTIAGLVLGTVVFTVGGMLLARWHHGKTAVGESLFGWPLKLARWATDRDSRIGLVVNTVFNGAPGISIVETSMGYNWKEIRRRAWVASSLYMSIWCVIHAVRPPWFIPIYWHPSWNAAVETWHMITHWVT